MASHSSTLAWKIPWMEEPGGLQSMRSRRVGHDWTTSFPFSLSCIGEGNGNPLLCSYLENPRDGGAWWPAINGVAQSWTWLKWLSSSSRKGIEITESVLLSLWNYVRNQYQKIFENNTHIFKCNVTFTRIFDLTIESLNKVRRLKKPLGRLQRRKHLSGK